MQVLNPAIKLGHILHKHGNPIQKPDQKGNLKYVNASFSDDLNFLAGARTKTKN